MEKFINKFKENLRVEFKFKNIMYLVLILLVAVDLISKFIADDVLKTKTINVIDGYFNLALAYNSGVSFSMFSSADAALLLSVIAILAGMVLSIVALSSVRKIDVFCYYLIAAGAYGNGIDRFINGHVIDFLDFYYKNWHYPTFNFADCFIVIGVFILLTEGLFFNKK